VDWRGHIYFVTDGEAIKIGFAERLRARMHQLQVANHFPLFLIGSVRGTRADEANLHARFGRLRIRGEWFKIHKEIFDYTDHVDGWIEGDDIQEYRRKNGFLDD
jgi:hypothetical protein